MRFFHDQNNKNFRTKPLNIFIFCLVFIVIPGLVLWLLFGYINFSMDFLVFPAYGIIGKGTTSQLITHLQYIYNKSNVYDGIRIACYDLSLLLKKQPLSGYATVNLANFTTSYYSSMLAAVCVPYIAWSIGLPFLGKLTKLINYDTITFSLTCCMMFVVLIITGGIPVGKTSGNGFDNIGGWIIFARIVITALSLPLWFFTANRIVLACLGLAKDKEDYYLQLTDEAIKTQKDLTELRKKRKETMQRNKEPVYVEINDQQIKLINKDKDKKKKK